MVKRIKRDKVRLRMFIGAIDGNWQDQRFWRSRFLLDSLNKVEALTGHVKGIIINTKEDADVASIASGKDAQHCRARA